MVLVFGHDPDWPQHLCAAAGLCLNILGALGQAQLNLFLEAVGIGPNLRQLVTGKIVKPLKCSNTVSCLFTLPDCFPGGVLIR